MARRNRAAQTAFGPTVLAAIEQNEPPRRRLVDDDLAAALLPLRLRVLVAATRVPPVRHAVVRAVERAAPGLWANILCRRRFTDDHLSAVLAESDAVIILGSGFDTRGYHLAGRSRVPVFEVDLPVNIARKRAAVTRALGTPPPSVRYVPMDFERDDLATTLAEHGYRAGHRAFVVWEGVTQYLTADAVHATLRQLSSLPPGSRLTFSYVQRDFIDGANLYGAPSAYRRFRVRNQVWHFGLRPDEVAAFIGGHGWTLAEQAGPDYHVNHYIRPTGRRLAASDLEWTAYAVKDSANTSIP
ncbi:methyltransferase, TIGR00027 family [Mycolicibacterium rutilum]|uniref:S-adenosyl-L-methionine-dependent methyltransferase n=1 Tax=Mycolicibacterium rutilum TaxID=370526 RepID=A0A1H6LE77_MYCRU|nr:SAM-dependent methyltransferase [Mycolicibacterium rutilum]SEH84360.1 methyltransferase, TIGR00027 family [Mycolicibacterium rutilum]